MQPVKSSQHIAVPIISYTHQEIINLRHETNTLPRKTRRLCWKLKINRQSKTNCIAKNSTERRHIAEFHSSNSEKELQIIRSPADGHCFLHSVIYGLYSHGHCVDTDELIALLQHELFAKLNIYSMFCPGEDLPEQLKLYTRYKIYNTALGDLVPLITANSLHRTIRVYRNTNTQEYLDITPDSDYIQHNPTN